MQTVKANESRVLKSSNETINGINLSVLLEADAFNQIIPDTDYRTTTGFDPSQVNIQVQLKRKGTTKTILNCNLGVLAQLQTIKQMQHLWRRGVTLREASNVTKHLTTRNLFIYFGGHINLTDTDELEVTLVVSRNAIGTSLSSANSNISIELNQSIGVEYAIHSTHVYSIDQQQESDQVVLGDNVTQIALLSFEKDPKKEIFKGCTLSSDRLDWTANYQTLITRHYDKFDHFYSDKIITDSVGNYGTPFFYPNTFLIHDKDEIDKAKIAVNLESLNIQSSQNFIAYTKFETNQEVLMKGLEMKQKHEQRNMEKVPFSFN